MLSSAATPVNPRPPARSRSRLRLHLVTHATSWCGAQASTGVAAGGHARQRRLLRALHPAAEGERLAEESALPDHSLPAGVGHHHACRRSRIGEAHRSAPTCTLVARYRSLRARRRPRARVPRSLASIVTATPDIGKSVIFLRGEPRRVAAWERLQGDLIACGWLETAAASAPWCSSRIVVRDRCETDCRWRCCSCEMPPSSCRPCQHGLRTPHGTDGRRTFCLIPAGWRGARWTDRGGSSRSRGTPHTFCLKRSSDTAAGEGRPGHTRPPAAPALILAARPDGR